MRNPLPLQLELELELFVPAGCGVAYAVPHWPLSFVCCDFFFIL